MPLVFGDYALDIDRRELIRAGERVAVAPQVFDLLVYLLRNRERVVSKDDLIEAVWGGRIVSESALTTRLNAVRNAIGDSGAEQRLIRTVSRRGVRFIGEVREESELPSAATLTAPLAGATTSTRRLTAIFAANVVGYSRLMKADEEGTIRRPKALRAEMIDPKIAEHHGRIVKTTGDGLLAEFGSTVDALRCASEIQTQIAERDFALAPDARTEWRIGIHQGHFVVEDNGDIFGDDVNIAARLEALAQPGGICVSARVQEDAAGKLDLTFRDLGEQQLKNIARPVRAYAVGAGPRAKGSAASAQQVPRLSIVVLPFANLSNDPDQQYFADGITEDLTTDLSRIPGMLVISLNTAFTYRDRRASTRQIGRELGVRYVLEGSVRRSANRVRVTIQLIDAGSDAHLWAERFDRELGDFFELQDEVTVQIARLLEVELTAAEAARTVEHLDCLDCLLRGRAAFRKPRSRVHADEQIGWFERALALDPHSADAQMWLAIALATRALDFVPSSSDADIERAEGLARQALAASPRSAIAHQVMGQVLRVQRRYAEAISEYEAALTLDRNRLGALADIGWCKPCIGAIDEAIAFQEQAIRLSPRDPLIFEWYCRIGEAHLLQSRVDQAIGWLEKSRSASPAVWYVHAWLAAAYALAGDPERARAALVVAKSLQGTDFERSLAHMADRFAAPEVRAQFETNIGAGLRKAGWQEE